MSDADEKSVRLPAGSAASLRRWSEAEKRWIVAESCQPGVSVALVARRNDLNVNLRFNWRRKFRERRGFVPEAVEPDLRISESSAPRRLPGSRSTPDAIAARLHFPALEARRR